MWGGVVDQWAWMTDWQNTSPNQIIQNIQSRQLIFWPRFTNLGHKILVSHTTSFPKPHCSSNESVNSSFTFQKILKIPDLLWQSHLITLHHDIRSWSFYLKNFIDLGSISSCGYNWKRPSEKIILFCHLPPLLFN